MNAIKTFTGVGSLLLLANLAMAQSSSMDQSAKTPSSANPSASSTMQATPPSNSSSTTGTSTSTDSSSDNSNSGAVEAACQKQASAKNLSGGQKDDFMKKCKAGKTTRSGG